LSSWSRKFYVSPNPMRLAHASKCLLNFCRIVSTCFCPPRKSCLIAVALNSETRNCNHTACWSTLSQRSFPILLLSLAGTSRWSYPCETSSKSTAAQHDTLCSWARTRSRAPSDRSGFSSYSWRRNVWMACCVKELSGKSVCNLLRWDHLPFFWLGRSLNSWNNGNVSTKICDLKKWWEQRIHELIVIHVSRIKWTSLSFYEDFEKEETQQEIKDAIENVVKSFEDEP